MKITRVLQSTILAAVVATSLLINPAAASARVFVSVGFAPPAIPVYAQPVAPAYGYIWTPGYWAYGPDGYTWVDGAWVEPPYEGALWTPGYWDYAGGVYVWSPGYWGRHVGYYGGVNYGFGYFGVGFWGGYWNGGHFFYNREYNHLGFRDHEGFVYSHPVAGFNGRPGGEAFARGQAAGYNHTAIAQNRSSVVSGNARPAYTGTARGYSTAPRSSYSGGSARRGNYSGGGARTGGGGGAHFNGGGEHR